MFAYSFCIWHVSIGLLVAGVCLYSICLILYRLFFHPLSKFPGSKIAAATKWYEFYWDIISGEGGQYTWEIERMHEAYGPIIRITPDELHVKDPDWYPILYSGPTSRRDRYPPAAKMIGVTGAAFSTVSHVHHRLRRRALNPYFSKNSIAQLEPFIQRRIKLLCRSLIQQSKEGPVELHTLYLAFANDTVCSFAFHHSMNLLEDPNIARDWKATIGALAGMTPLVKQFPWLHDVTNWVPGSLLGRVSPKLGRIIRLKQRMQHEAATAVNAHEELVDLKRDHQEELKSEAPSRPTLFNHLLRSNLPAEEKTARRIGEEAFSIIAAGGETVARTLTIATYHLLANPTALQSLRAELKDIQPDPNTLLTFEIAEKLPWLTAVVKESLRIWGVVFSRIPLTTNKPLQYCEWVIPPGTPVGMTPMNVLHDPNIYPDPFTFNPSRWLGSQSERERLDRYNVAFGKGDRMCVGMSLAYTELYLALAAIVRRFDLELFDTERTRDVDTSRDCFTGEASLRSQGTQVIIKRSMVE